MISLRTALLATFILAVSYQHATAKPHTPVECCFHYMPKPIQLSKLVDFYWTPKECHLPAVVFVTGANRQVCADPAKPWTKAAIKFLTPKRKQIPLSRNHR
ncbi:C-C motif chemokine 5-like [Emydura macquarii macquarii]|uniref:C-C motif chemokine 5-like n=1 Tax=Emydura macquarii macquarii TaxID=1129001 RepID=UPI00352B98F7